jgi:hypothetical protein
MERRGLRQRLEGFAYDGPGIVFCMVIAFASFLIWNAYRPISTLMWSFIIGIVVSNLIDLPEGLRSGGGSAHRSS